MGMTRVEVRHKGIHRWSRAGDGWLAYPATPVADATDAGVTITDEQMKGGIALFTGFTGGNTITTRTAAQIIAALPGMNVGDTYTFMVVNTAAQVGTYTAGDGDVTLAGHATVNAGSHHCIVEKTSATTVTLTFV